MGVVRTIEGSCSMCFSCIRNCPVKAIKVEKGQAKVIPELCIYCGHCVEVCSQKAKTVLRGVEDLKSILESPFLKVACLAPSFAAEFTEIQPGQVINALKQAGFDAVYEVALGAKLVAEEYKKLMESEKQSGLISTTCPSIVFLVEKYFPSLIPRLVPVVSPMIALARFLKKKYEGRDIRIVFIGPCTAKKAEFQDANLAGSVDGVLTFPEIRTFLKEKKIEARDLPVDAVFDNPPLGIYKLFPISGGLLKTASLTADILDNNILVIEGRENSLQFLKNVEQGRISFDFADILFCQGCTGGPMYTQSVDPLVRMQQVKKYALSKEDMFVSSYDQEHDRAFAKACRSIDLSRTYSNKHVFFQEPSKEQIDEVLHSLEKYTVEDELNCGACGYETCRSKAAAVVRGFAEKQMCLPYLIKRLEKNYMLLKSQMEASGSGVGRFVGNSRVMQQVYQMIKKVAKTDTTVLITGESGTGKELAARAIHDLSLRSDQNFVSINCAAIPENLLESELFGHVKGSFTGAINDKKGLFEEAHKGTIFLDEIGDLSPALQSKLLRVLQEGEFLRIGETRSKKVDTRIIAATNRNLQELIARGEFRADLFYRLNVISIGMPPLREKREDIPILAIYFLQKFSKKNHKLVERIDNDAMDALLKAEWKGNVRELENVIERAVILCDGSEIQTEDLPPELMEKEGQNNQDILDDSFSLKDYMEEQQKLVIIEALRQSEGVQAKAAKMLGLKKSTFHEMLKRYKLER
ncbi:MAG: sigma 54-interacting transcriptional regulator [Bacillota bacterium]